MTDAAPFPVLRPMDEARFAQYAQTSSVDYAADKVQAGQWLPATALQRAQAELAGLLPQGLATPGHTLYDILAPDDGRTVGWLWVAIEDREGLPTAYIYDVAVDEAEQRRGHARRAFIALEALVRAQGAQRLDLHVFGHNPGAQALYASLGFRVTSVMMAKPLDAPAA